MKKKTANVRKEKAKNRNKNRNKELIKLIDRSIPGYPEISDWYIPVKAPFSIGLILNFRCYSHTALIIEDANKTPFTFFFDDFLGRLCFGAESYQEETAAYIKANSKLEKEAFAAIESAINDFQPEFSEDYHGLSLIRARLEKAKVYAGSKDIMPSFLLDKAR